MPRKSRRAKDPVTKTAQVVAYLRSVARSRTGSATTGDAARGKVVFAGKGTCVNCHRVDGEGGRLGPDLSSIGQLRRAVELERSLVEPDTEVLGGNRSYRIITKDGSTITGRLLNLDTFTVQLLDSKEQLRSFVKSDLRDHGFGSCRRLFISGYKPCQFHPGKKEKR